MIQLNAYLTLVAAAIVLLLGKFFVKNISFLKNNHIPEAVAGGFIISIALLILSQTTGIGFAFDGNLQTLLMTIFFTCIGLSANFSRLLQGGKPLVLFIIIVSVMIVIQNIVGMSLAISLGQNPFYGLIAGSITLAGGHGNGAAWGAVLAEKYGLEGAVELAMACATFGLVLGGLVGGPVARHLLKKIKQPKNESGYQIQEAFEEPQTKRKVNTASVTETIGMLAISISIGSYVDMLTKDSILQMPTFVWCVFSGILLRNTINHILRREVSEETIDVLGNVSLAFFLAMALMSLKLTQLAGLAAPILIIIAIQTIIMVFFAIYVTFKVMGSNYDAVVMSAGNCGLGLGATPTAIANMQAITKIFGPSHKSFLVVPMVGAFFIDISNSIFIKIFIEIGSKLGG